MTEMETDDIGAAAAGGGEQDDAAVESWKVPSDDPRWKDISGDGGLLKWVLREGDEFAEGPTDGQKIKAHYSGFLTENGDKFDSSRDRDEFFEFEVGKGRVIKGWDEGFMTMKEGERAVLRCSAAYGYGESGSPPKIPGGASLDFVVSLEELCDDWEDVYQTDDCIQKKEKVKGKWDKVNEHGTITATYTVRKGDAEGEIVREGKEEDILVPYNEEFEVNGELVAKCPEYKYQRAFYKCLRETGEDSTYQFRVRADPRWADADYWYEIQCVKMAKKKPNWEMEPDEKVVAAKTEKEMANRFFKAGKYKVAIKVYENAARLCDESKFTAEQKKEVEPVFIASKSNLAAVYVKQEEWAKVIEACNEGLKKDSKNVKMLYRRAVAYNAESDWDEALQDLEAALAEDPDNAVCKRLRKTVKKSSKDYWRKQKALAQGFFAAK